MPVEVKSGFNYRIEIEGSPDFPRIWQFGPIDYLSKPKYQILNSGASCQGLRR
jgi:hypothetical protein